VHKKMMATTIKDIARQAGVSHTTVSRALHNSPLLSEETIQRIQVIANELGYHPSFAARSLKTNRSQALGVIVSHIADPFFSEILQGIDDVAQANGYSLFIAAAQHDPQRECAIVQSMRDHSVDGVILCSPQHPIEKSQPLQSFQIPIVAINNQSDEDYSYSIYHDDVDGGRQACDYLVGIGHERIAYLGDAASGRTTRERLSGFRQVMAEHGLVIPDEYLYQVPGNSFLNGVSAAKYFLSLPIIPSAIICYNDILAIGLMKGFTLAGLHIPRDISLTGFDNIQFSDFTNPPLTTIDQPKRSLGAEAARMMISQLSQDCPSEASIIKRLKGTLLVRKSTAPPAQN
jgi:DNA-binding LacI/PurR family transcriptional regulator